MFNLRFFLLFLFETLTFFVLFFQMFIFFSVKKNSKIKTLSSKKEEEEEEILTWCMLMIIYFINYDIFLVKFLITINDLFLCVCTCVCALICLRIFKYNWLNRFTAFFGGNICSAYKNKCYMGEVLKCLIGGGRFICFIQQQQQQKLMGF